MTDKLPDSKLDTFAKILNVDVAGLTNEQKREKMLNRLREAEYKPLTPEDVQEICEKHDLTYFETQKPWGQPCYQVKSQREYDLFMEHLYPRIPSLFWGGLEIVEKFPYEVEACK